MHEAAAVGLSVNVDGLALSLPGLLALGGVVGLIAGIFGVGGGFLLTPMLTALFGVPAPIAVGSGLCQMIGTAAVTLLRRRNDRQGEPRFDLFMLGGSLLGVDAGARALAALSRAGDVALGGKRLPLVTLAADGLFAALLLAVAALFWWQGGQASPGQPRPGPLARLGPRPRVDLPGAGLRAVSAPLIAYVGLLLGFMSGLLGVGGGVLLLPLLVHGFGFSIQQAAGTGVLVLLVSSSLGTFLHALRGNVRLELAFPLLIASSLSAQVGARVARGLPARALRRGFSLVASAAALVLLWHIVR